MQKLDRMQLQQVALLLHFKDKPVSIRSLAWYNRQSYVGFCTIAVLGMALEYWAFGGIGAAFVAVAIAAVLLRDIGYYRRSKNSWPILLKVIEWEKVEQLVQQPGSEA